MERTKARTQHLDNKILFKIQELHGPRLDKAMTFYFNGERCFNLGVYRYFYYVIYPI